MAKFKPSDTITVRGVTKSITEFSADKGWRVQTVLGRLERGWTPDRAIDEPIGQKGGANRGKKSPAEVLTPDELQRLLAQCSKGSTGDRNRALIVIGWRAGLRISEALDLQTSNLDVQQQTVRILHGKGDKARTVGLDAQAWAVVQAWLNVRTAVGIGPGAPLFCTLQGGRMDARYVRELMPRLARDAGIAKRVHYHGLRHTHAFELAGEGLAIHVIQQQLGHSNAAITSRYLAHLNPAETIAKIKARTWDKQPIVSAGPSAAPVPGWLDRLRQEIGQRLMLFHDARTDEADFRAIVLLF
jgi:integrase